VEKYLLRTKQTNRFGKKLFIAGVLLQFDAKGITEVTDENIANTLIKKYEFENVGEPIVDFNEGNEESQALIDEVYVLRKENEALKIRIAELETALKDNVKEEVKEETKEEDIKEEKEESKEEEKSADPSIEDLVASKKKSELLDLCQEFQLPKEEWEKLTAEGLRNYIIEKVNG
jgi:hypothetical protein